MYFDIYLWPTEASALTIMEYCLQFSSNASLLPPHITHHRYHHTADPPPPMSAFIRAPTTPPPKDSLLWTELNLRGFLRWPHPLFLSFPPATFSMPWSHWSDPHSLGHERDVITFPPPLFDLGHFPPIHLIWVTPPHPCLSTFSNSSAWSVFVLLVNKPPHSWIWLCMYMTNIPPPMCPYPVAFCPPQASPSPTNKRTSPHAPSHRRSWGLRLSCFLAFPCTFAEGSVFAALHSQLPVDPGHHIFVLGPLWLVFELSPPPPRTNRLLPPHCPIRFPPLFSFLSSHKSLLFTFIYRLRLYPEYCDVFVCV